MLVKTMRFALNRLHERLWIKPALMCLGSVVLVYLTRYAHRLPFPFDVPDISQESINTLLEVLAAGMLVIATLAVASMVSSYNYASTSATPRAFPLVVADDLSQYALSTFIGAFIFSVVTLVAVQNSYYDKPGRFAVLVLTLLVFTVVILVFMRWVDGIARLGLLGNTVEKVEKATASSLAKRIKSPTMGGTEVETDEGNPVEGRTVGYVQMIDMERLQRAADAANLYITVQALPGRLMLPGRALVTVRGENGERNTHLDSETESEIVAAFVVGDERTYDEDPRFGLVALAQIACRALSPAVNDPGTAIDIIAAYVRLFCQWCASSDGGSEEEPSYPRVAVPRLQLTTMFDDAFAAISREGADNVAVAVRVQTALASLASLSHPEVAEAARKQARLALKRAENALAIEEDLVAVRNASIGR